MSLENWREGLFQLCWQQHGGSGLSASIEEGLELFIADRDWMLERISSQRQHEAREIEKASKKK